MFSCTACKPADPATATVKVDPSLLTADRENVAPNSQLDKAVELERQQKEEQARERARLERKAEEERRHREAERREQERREQERREQEQREQERLEAERRAEEREAERRRIAAEAERARKEQEERRKREEMEQQEENRRREDQEKLSAFLSSKGYGTDVNGKRKTMMKYYHPLHDAVHAKDDDLVRILLEAGADPTLKSSSGKTALDRASKSNVDGSLQAIVERLTAVTPL
mmetsp:Transcript_54406/g.100513  ORF Transcript_54406/g.100513 Transcript_54406/m.100513 type:complete len:231 (-) Transcript_54406:384-1076(-)